MFGEPLDEAASRGCAVADVNAYAGGLELGRAAADYIGVGIERRDMRLCDAGGDDGVGAGGRSAVVIAGLQRGVERSAARKFAGGRQRRGFGVHAAGRMRFAHAHNSAVSRDDAAHGGVWACTAQRSVAQRQRLFHMPRCGSMRRLPCVRRRGYGTWRVRLHRLLSRRRRTCRWGSLGRRGLRWAASALGTCCPSRARHTAYRRAWSVPRRKADRFSCRSTALSAG